MESLWLKKGMVINSHITLQFALGKANNYVKD